MKPKTVNTYDKSTEKVAENGNFDKFLLRHGLLPIPTPEEAAKRAVDDLMKVVDGIFAKRRAS